MPRLVQPAEPHIEDEGPYWVALDANLAYNSTTGVSGTIWRGNPLAETSPAVTIDEIFPPLELKDGHLPEDTICVIEKIDGRWYPNRFQREFKGALAADLTYGESTGVVVDLSGSRTLIHVLPLPGALASGEKFPDEADCVVSLLDDGKWYLTYCSECPTT